MEQITMQINAITEELGMLKQEIVGVKASHASLHQQSVDHSVLTAGRSNEAMQKIQQIEEKMANLTNPFADKSQFKKSLIEPKQVEVEKFAGAIMDSRVKFLAWSERVKDRAELFDTNLSEAMTKVEGEEGVITSEKSTEMGIPVASSRELHGFLKDRTDGTAASIVRDNKSGVGLESWRQLCRNFNPRTLQGT